MIDTEMLGKILLVIGGLIALTGGVIFFLFGQIWSWTPAGRYLDSKGGEFVFTFHWSRV